jgi:hypothetical protein
MAMNLRVCCIIKLCRVGYCLPNQTFVLLFCMRHPSLGPFLLLRSENWALLDYGARGLVRML